jgi:hypothetical protein
MPIFNNPIKLLESARNSLPTRLESGNLLALGLLLRLPCHLASSTNHPLQKSHFPLSSLTKSQLCLQPSLPFLLYFSFSFFSPSLSLMRFGLGKENTPSLPLVSALSVFHFLVWATGTYPSLTLLLFSISLLLSLSFHNLPLSLLFLSIFSQVQGVLLPVVK